MDRRVAGVATAVLVATTDACVRAVAAVPEGARTDTGATPGSVAPNSLHAATTGVELAVAGLVVLGLGGALVWYLRETEGVDSEPASESAVDAADTGREQSPASDEQSDEQRVLELLRENNGRIKQARIVERTDWSKSKVSLLLSEMESNDQISKLRVGRENLISLAGNEPEAAGSPFEELKE
jgi:uncharacterized membrane protein